MLKNSLLDNFPSGEIVSENSIAIGSISQDLKDYYINVIKFLDQQLYFNYLQNTDPLYGLNYFHDSATQMNVDLNLSIPKILYSRAFPDEAASEFDENILIYIANKLSDGIILSLDEIRLLKN